MIQKFQTSSLSGGIDFLQSSIIDCHNTTQTNTFTDLNAMREGVIWSKDLNG